MSDLAALGLLAVIVIVAAVAGLIVGRMIGTRIDRWQQAAQAPAEEEPGDNPDPG
jgi:hypothetical protein